MWKSFSPLSPPIDDDEAVDAFGDADDSDIYGSVRRHTFSADSFAPSFRPSSGA
jgi:hypothetical protein